MRESFMRMCRRSCFHAREARLRIRTHEPREVARVELELTLEEGSAFTQRVEALEGRALGRGKARRHDAGEIASCSRARMQRQCATTGAVHRARLWEGLDRGFDSLRREAVLGENDAKRRRAVGSPEERLGLRGDEVGYALGADEGGEVLTRARQPVRIEGEKRRLGRDEAEGLADTDGYDRLEQRRGAALDEG